MTGLLDATIARFRSADRQTRLDLLLDYARRLPALPERFHAAREEGQNRVPECQSPVFLYLERNDGRLQLHGDAPREAPTVRGFVSLLVQALHQASPQQIAAIPPDLLDQLALADALGMTRIHGLTAIVARLRRMAADLEEDGSRGTVSAV